MERAARLFKNQKFPKDLFTEETVARAAWVAAVGKAISSRTNASKLVRDKLIVFVEDAVWQRQLNALSAQIIQQLHRVMGSAIVQELEFRIAIAKRAPQREGSRASLPQQSLALADEADSISDPVLKKVYRLSRKKATA